jgi:hypothetical protein
LNSLRGEPMTIEERYARRFEAYKLNLSDIETVKLLNEPLNTYSNWRRRMGLKSHALKYKPNKIRDKFKLTDNTGVPMVTAITDPEQREKMEFFLRLVSRCKPENVSDLILEIRKNGIREMMECLSGKPNGSGS